jgi:hypothetical protein
MGPGACRVVNAGLWAVMDRRGPARRSSIEPLTFRKPGSTRPRSRGAGVARIEAEWRSAFPRLIRRAVAVAALDRASAGA